MSGGPVVTERGQSPLGHLADGLVDWLESQPGTDAVQGVILLDDSTESVTSLSNFPGGAEGALQVLAAVARHLMDLGTAAGVHVQVVVAGQPVTSGEPGDG